MKMKVFLCSVMTDASYDLTETSKIKWRNNPRSVFTFFKKEFIFFFM